MGPYRYDAFHPTGSQRAARILSCLPPALVASAEPVAEPSDVSGGAEVSFPSGGASGEGLVALEEGAVLAVRWRSGEPPAVVRQ